MIDHPLTECRTERAHGHQCSVDPHAQAAMLLVESVIHCLTAHSVITVADAIEVVEVASDVAEQIECDPTHVPARSSTMILDAIRESLSTDLRGDRMKRLGTPTDVSQLRG